MEEQLQMPVVCIDCGNKIYRRLDVCYTVKGKHLCHYCYVYRIVDGRRVEQDYQAILLD